MIVSIRLRTIMAILLVLLIAGGIVAGVLGVSGGGLAAIPVDAQVSPELLAAADGSYIKWVDFNVPLELMKKTLELDIKSQNEEVQLSWVELLAYLGARYGGKYKSFRQKDLDAVVERLRAGETMEEIADGMKYYSYYIEAYAAVLGGLVGYYLVETPGEDGATQWVQKYGLKAFSPIAKGYGFSHYKDFGDGRSYGYNRKHLGNDLMGRVGTPIVAVESGVVEVMGWNMYGGWRIGIRSFDGKRYYYYAHLRKDHPFHADLYEGKAVTAGEVIGYLGMTGYSTKPNVNNIRKPHLHFGLQLIFDESQKEGVNQIWVDVYALVELLQKSRVQVRKDEEKKEYYRVYNLLDPAVPTNY